MIVCHTDKGGAYRVAKFHAKALGDELLISPSISSFIKHLLSCAGNRAIFFHNPALALKLGFIARLLRPFTKIFCVEHFVTTQIMKEELKTSTAKKKFLFIMRAYPALGITPISLDDYSLKNRRRVAGCAGKIITNPVFNSEQPPRNHEFDIVWSAGLSPQKMWPEVIDVLSSWKERNPQLKIAAVSYNEPTKEETRKLENAGIKFFMNRRDWQQLAPVFFFTSKYEGYPLSLIEAAKENMRIIAWCNPACRQQLLKNIPSSVWFDSRKNIPDISEIFFTQGNKPNSQWLEKHKPEEVQKALLLLQSNHLQS